ncbi:putative membrane associated protein [Streptococcus oralis]|uniref:Putative membrane associated protein n=2 Tax=Streptococcus oralis TaxID=1303 RepID=A0A139PFH2_STROR|nr:putative membrane associated protein [Streptococcus oralis]
MTDMRKLTKGFLIFGVVATILGFIMIVVGAQSNGIQSLLAMSKDPVYDNRIEEVTFGNEVEKLDLALEEHSLTITESVDDKIHITYHPSMSGRHDLTTGMSDKTLSVTDKQASQHRFLGSGIEGLLRIASSYSHRFDEVILSLPKGRRLQAITVSANRGQTNIRQANLENATIKTKGYLLRLTESSIKNSTLTTPHIINIFDTELTDSKLESTENHFHAEKIQVHGKVELVANTDLNLLLSEEEKQRINLDLSTKHGSIIHFQREGRRSFKNEENKDERLSNPYKTEKADVKDQLIARADQDIYLLKAE